MGIVKLFIMHSPAHTHTHISDFHLALHRWEYLINFSSHEVKLLTVRIFAHNTLFYYVLLY